MSKISKVERMESYRKNLRSTYDFAFKNIIFLNEEGITEDFIIENTKEYRIENKEMEELLDWYVGYEFHIVSGNNKFKKYKSMGQMMAVYDNRLYYII